MKSFQIEELQMQRCGGTEQRGLLGEPQVWKQNGKRLGSRVRLTWVRILTLMLISCMTLSKPLVSIHSFSHASSIYLN